MIDYKNESLTIPKDRIVEGSISWKSPSNIALIKYWGKYGIQLPRNPSISFTLDKACTTTHLKYTSKTLNDHEGIDIDFYFEGEKNIPFANKIKGYFARISEIFPFVNQLSFTIHSENSFPHSSGIASSASSMSALALCLCSVENEIFGTLNNDTDFRKKASFVSRLGSGSACRSVYPNLCIWGEIENIPEASNLYGIPFGEEVDPVFNDFHDDILIVSQGEKAVSSTAGHALMEGNAYAAPRYQQANDRLNRLIETMKTGDVDTFGNIVENEALTLHALMMTSHPSYILMEANSLIMIQKIRSFRQKTKLPIFFTLDAGPNLHVLYPHSICDHVNSFILNELVPLCENNKIIRDRVGLGSERI